VVNGVGASKEWRETAMETVSFPLKIKQILYLYFSV